MVMALIAKSRAWKLLVTIGPEHSRLKLHTGTPLIVYQSFINSARMQLYTSTGSRHLKWGMIFRHRIDERIVKLPIIGYSRLPGQHNMPWQVPHQLVRYSLCQFPAQLWSCSRSHSRRPPPMGRVTQWQYILNEHPDFVFYFTEMCVLITRMYFEVGYIGFITIHM